MLVILLIMMIIKIQMMMVIMVIMMEVEGQRMGWPVREKDKRINSVVVTATTFLSSKCFVCRFLLFLSWSLLQHFCHLNVLNLLSVVSFCFFLDHCYYIFFHLNVLSVVLFCLFLVTATTFLETTQVSRSVSEPQFRQSHNAAP